MAFAIEGFKSVAQNYISVGIASNFYPRLPFLSALGAFTLTRNNKTSLSIGRPDGGEILTGKRISPAERMDLQNFNSYQPRIQAFSTSNSKWMGARDTNPTVANATTQSHGQAMQAAALFNRCKIKTPILIWHVDKERALRSGSTKGQGLAMSKLIDEATEVGYQDHVAELNDKIWNGNPSNQAMDPWDKPLGILQAFSATNVYGNVNRNLQAVWAAIVDSGSYSADLEQIVDLINVTKGVADLHAGGVDLLIVPKAIYLIFKAQLLSKGGGALHVLPNGIPGMAQIGVKQEVLQKDNVFVMYDASCPANTVLGFIMDAWRLAIVPGKNLTVSPFTDLSDKAEGAKEADQAFIETEFIFSCDNPGLQTKLSNVA